MTKALAAISAVAAALALATAPNVQAQNQAARVFSASGSWTADFGDDYYRLSREFSDGDDRILLALEKIEPTASLRALLIGDGIRLYRGAETIGYRFLPSGEETPSQLLRSTTGDGEQLLIINHLNVWPSPIFVQVYASRAMTSGEAAQATTSTAAPPAFNYDPAAEQEFAAAIQGLMLGQGTTKPVQIDTGPLNEVLRVLQDCTNDLLLHWGLDADKHADKMRGAFPLPSEILPRGTIHFSEFSKLAGGYNQVRVMVSSEGKPSACEIHFPTLDRGQNEKICANVMQNAEFVPALDADGQPMASYWIAPVIFLFGPPVS